MSDTRPELGHNLSETMKKIQKAIGNVNKLKDDRKAINADIQAIREGLEALGIHKVAFDMAMRYLSWEPEKRQGFDLAYSLVREAGGLPIQADLFAEAEKTKSDVKAAADAAKPTAKDIADRKFEQVTRSKMKSDEPPAGPDAAGIASHLENEDNAGK